MDYGKASDWEREYGTYGWDDCKSCGNDIGKVVYHRNCDPMGWICPACYEKHVTPTLEPLTEWTDELIGQRVQYIGGGGIYYNSGDKFKVSCENVGTAEIENEKGEKFNPSIKYFLRHFALVTDTTEKPVYDACKAAITINGQTITGVESFSLDDITETTMSGTIIFKDGSKAVIPVPNPDDGWKEYHHGGKFELNEVIHFDGALIAAEWEYRAECEGIEFDGCPKRWKRTLEPVVVETYKYLECYPLLNMGL